MKALESWVLQSRGPSCDGSYSGSCSHLGDVGNHQTQENLANRKAEPCPRMFAPGWVDFQKRSNDWGSSTCVPRILLTLMPVVQNIISGSGRRHVLMFTVRIQLIIQSYNNLMIAKNRVQIKWTHCSRNYHLLAEVFIFQLSVSNLSLLLPLTTEIGSLIFDQSVISKGSTALILPLFSKNAMTHPTHQSINKYFCMHT